MAITQQVHPRLLKLAEDRLAAEASAKDAAPEPETPVLDTPAEQVADATVPAPSDVATELPPAPAEDEDFIVVRFPKKPRPEDIEAAIGSNPHLLNVWNSQIGRKAKREYEPKVQALQSELDQIRAAQLQAKFAGIPPEQLGEQLRTNPQARQEYEAAQRQTPQAIQARNEYMAAINEIAEGTSPDAVPDVVDRLKEAIGAGDFDTTVENGQQVRLNSQRGLGVFGREVNAYSSAVSSLDDEARDAYHQAFTNGWYNVRRGPDEQPVLDQYGREQPVSRRESVAQMTAAMRRYTEYARTQARTAPAATPAKAQQVQQPAAAPAAVVAGKPAPVANLALAAAAPDLTPPAVSRGVGRMSVTDYSALTPPEKLRAAPRGLDAALKDGSIYRQ